MNVSKMYARMTLRGLRPGKLSRIRDYASRNKFMQSRDLLSPMRVAWFLYFYGCAPLNPRSFKSWSDKKIEFFNELAKIGEPNPIQAIAQFLKDPKGTSEIRDLAVDRKTGAVAIITKDMEFKNLTPYIDTPPESPYQTPELIIYPNILLVELAEMIREAQAIEKERFLN